MKQRITKTILATSLCVAMLGTTCFAADITTRPGTGGTTIDGDNTVVNPIYKLALPSDLTFAVDPFEQEGKSMIASGDYSIINKSNVAVQVDFDVKVANKVGATDVKFKATEAEVTENTDEKLVYMAATVPEGITETSATEDVIPGLWSVTTTAEQTPIHVIASSEPTAKAAALLVDPVKYASAEAGLTAVANTTAKFTDVTAATFAANAAEYDVVLGETNTKLSFALDKATYSTDIYAATGELKPTFKTIAATTTGSTVFRFTGKVNTNADWLADDIHAEAVYTFIGKSNDTYTELMTKNVVIEGTKKAHALIETAPAIQTKTFNSLSPADVTYTTTAVVTKVTIKKASASTPTVCTSTAFSSTASSVTFKNAWLAGVASSGTADFGKGNYTVTFTYAGGTTETANLVMN